MPRKRIAERESGSKETCQELFPDCLCEDLMAVAE